MSTPTRCATTRLSTSTCRSWPGRGSACAICRPNALCSRTRQSRRSRRRLRRNSKSRKLCKRRRCVLLSAKSWRTRLRADLAGQEESGWSRCHSVQRRHGRNRERTRPRCHQKIRSRASSRNCTTAGRRRSWCWNEGGLLASIEDLKERALTVDAAGLYSLQGEAKAHKKLLVP